jgi:large subunit ribosomal protein L5
MNLITNIMTPHSHNPRRREIQTFLEKIVVDAGVGRLSQQPNFEEKGLQQIMRDLAAITGQKAEVRTAKKSIAGFKVREGQTVGLKITLRGARMVDFFERLITIVLPRVRDFGGLDVKSVDKGGVLSLGIRDHVVFPEVEPEQSPISFSLGISIVPKIRKQKQAEEEFRKLGVPLKKK